MRLKNTAFAYNVTVNGASNSDWGTDIGQGAKHTFTLDGFPEIINAMVYYKVNDVDNIKVILGKGNRTPKRFSEYPDNELVLASLFKKVYLNGALLEGQCFMMYILKETNQYNSKGQINVHCNRCTLKFSNSLLYREEAVNQNCIDAITSAFNLPKTGSWAILDIEIKNEDELHFLGFSLGEFAKDYSSKEERNQDYTKRYGGIQAISCNHALPLQQIYYGAPGTGKSHEINEQTKGQDVIRTTFHPDSDYSTFVGAYKPTSTEIPMRDVTGRVIKDSDGKDVMENRIIYEFVDQAFLQAYVKAWKAVALAAQDEEPKKQYLVIEEINRGNCAQIFGDLFQLLDRNAWGFSEYPIKADNDMKKQLQKAFKGLSIAKADEINALFDGKDIVSEVLNGECLLLPNNLYIWATMNTSDQSLFPIDSAFKRRWDWRYMPIDTEKESWKIRANGSSYSWTSFLNIINEIVHEKTQSEDKQLGFYFCKAKEGVIDAETFVGKVLFYLWNDVFKDYGFDDDFFEDEKLADGTFKPLAFKSFYDVKTRKVIESQAEKFLLNLKVERIEDVVEDEEDGNDADSEIEKEEQKMNNTETEKKRLSLWTMFNGIMKTNGRTEAAREAPTTSHYKVRFGTTGVYIKNTVHTNAFPQFPTSVYSEIYFKPAAQWLYQIVESKKNELKGLFDKNIVWREVNGTFVGQIERLTNFDDDNDKQAAMEWLADTSAKLYDFIKPIIDANK